MSPANINGAITSNDSIIARAARSALPGSRMPVATAYFLMISATPCTARNAKPSGIMILIGQRSRPPGSDECSQI